MDEAARTRLSRLLSLHLRHAPDGWGLSLGPGGWVPVGALLEGARRAGVRITVDDLREVVSHSDKQRFALDEFRGLIRANQGHSVEVDLELVPLEPPARLFHGTPVSRVEVILREGLRRMERHHVHLSPDEETAQRVGSRRGPAVILQVDAAAMHTSGFTFYCSDNGVWLVDAVPPRFLTVKGP